MATTRPSRAGGAGDGEDSGEGDAPGDGSGAGGAATGTVATAPSAIGPFRSSSSALIGSFRPRSVSAQDAGEVCTRFCATIPGAAVVAACRLRASWKAVITRNPRVISWKG